MDIVLVISWALFLCLIVSILIRTFPATYPRESVKKGAKRIQTIAIIISLVGCIIAIMLSRALNMAGCPSITLIEIKLAMMLIPVIACLLFSVFLYYPSVRFLVQESIEDQATMDSLLTCIFRSSYADDDGNTNYLNDLTELRDRNEEFVRQYGLSVYLTEYINQAQYPINNKPPEGTIRCVLDRCNQVKHDIDSYTPTPFPHIGLILSFVFSTLLTVLLSIVTIV